MATEKRSPIARGSHINPANRFEAVHLEDDWEQLDGDADALADANRPAVQYLPDASQSIVVENDSPDVPFRYSVNPYRGCAHGCAYWYAQPKRVHVENRTVLLISACKRRRSSWKYRPFAGLQNRGNRQCQQ